MTDSVRKHSLDANEAVAYVASRVSEVNAIYPITPSTPMAELVEQWSAEGQKNIWGVQPKVIELQSEGGASGAFHGALQAGALAATYTASQGLLLMIPNMYKIAGELTPAVMHVAARSLATHCLSIFGDHSDVMAVRSTGWAMLCSDSVQEAHDFALIAHAVTLKARVPFLHFFEGFRTSHEINKIEMLSDEQIRSMIPEEEILAHRARALNPEKPFIRGTAQNPDVYFQNREACNQYYTRVPELVEKAFEQFAQLTGRRYGLVDYYGAPDAKTIIVIMGSGSQTVRETINTLLKKRKKVGVIQVHLYRPFPAQAFLKALPKTVKAIAVLDRTKEPTAIGEPLYQDVISVFSEALMNRSEGMLKKMPMVIGGRYGLSSKEFTPAMVKAVFDELTQKKPKNHFTIGINDDVTFTSLNYDSQFITESDENVRALFFGLGADGTVGANKNSIKIIGEETDLYTQGYFVYDSKKSGSRTVSHLRFGPKKIESPYLIQSATFIAVHQFNFIEKIDVLRHAAKKAVILLNAPYGPKEIWNHLPRPMQETIIKKKLSLYVIDAEKIAEETGMGSRINTIMQTCFFALSGVLPRDVAIAKIKEAIRKTYLRKGEDVVRKNFEAVDHTLSHLYPVKIPRQVSAQAAELPPVVSSQAPEFVQKVTATLMADRGDDLPVSALPSDGTFPSATAQWEKRNISPIVSHWDPNLCIQCGRCSLICPHAVIRSKRYDKQLLAHAPQHFQSAPVKGKEGQNFTLQVLLEDCTGCGLCHEACPAKDPKNEQRKAINLTEKEPLLKQEKDNIDFFESLPEEDRTKIDTSTVPNIQFLQPLFEFSGACAGCGETPYIKLISQLFGDRMMVANATGCTSIYGGNLPTTPWTVNSKGQGPAWSNSLFEDNAEFGLGFKAAHDHQVQQAKVLLNELASTLGTDLVNALIVGSEESRDDQIAAQRARVQSLKNKLMPLRDKNNRAAQLLALADHLIKRSIWIIGGDGWAYDIDFGGLDHVLSMAPKVNLLVLDTEVYSNTGGQTSKATPLGAVAKFSATGKTSPKKDLGLMMMSYSYIYVAQIALGANMAQAVKAIREAEAYPGPSLIIAYSHCIAHGYNLQKAMNQQKLAVDCGYWPLYRYNPSLVKEGKNPFILDSQPPTVPLKDYIYQEARYKSLVQTDPKRAEELATRAQEEVNRKVKVYQEMASKGK